MVLVVNETVTAGYLGRGPLDSCSSPMVGCVLVTGEMCVVYISVREGCHIEVLMVW